MVQANAQNGSGISPAQANLMARNLVSQNAVKRTQQIWSGTVDPTTQPVINIPPRNVGLLLGFIVTVQTNVAVAASTGTVLTRTNFGPANLLTKVSFDDLLNNTRINVSGRYLSLLNSARGGAPYLAARTNDNLPMSYGNHFPSLYQGGATINQGANSDVSATYFVPLAYSDKDLRGSIWLNVVNATANLQLTLNQNVASARTKTGASDAVYATANENTQPADVSVDPFTVTVYQVYYDQLPMGQNGAILPMHDLATIYELKETAFSGIVQNQDFPLPYSNFRDFLSTFVLFRNNATNSLTFATEADIAYLALESANYTNIFKVEPRIAAAWGRQTIEDDFPLGCYYVPTRSKPISTVQYGNMQVILNANTVQSNASVIVGWEAFALTNIIGQAQSLPAAQ